MSSPKDKNRCECGECGKKEQRCCDAPYRQCHCSKIVLNVKPSKCILENCVYKHLYCKLYETILENCLEVRLNEMYLAANDPNTDAANFAYQNFVTFVTSLFCITLGTESLRLVITEQDGTVVLDTAKDSSVNTRANWKAKLINENHNSRLAILNTQLCPEGTGYETKLSSTVNKVQSYVAIRAGKFTNSSGTFRLSQNLCN